jgi:hypothetical protein
MADVVTIARVLTGVTNVPWIIVTIVPYARETKTPLAASFTLRTGPRLARAQGTMVTAGFDTRPHLKMQAESRPA